MRWVVLTVSLLIAIPLPALGAAGILFALLWNFIFRPSPVPAGYHYEHDNTSNGTKLVRDDD
jgi:hypothetical protein